VLIPVVDHGRDATVLLTKRAEKLRTTPASGFPGGTSMRPSNPGAAALRETFEEIGLGPDRIEIIGRSRLCRRQRLSHRPGAGDRATCFTLSSCR